jgi:hypothetical protein
VPKTNTTVRISRLELVPLAALVVLVGSSCRTKLNPALDGFSCDEKTGVCFPTDGGVDGSDGPAGSDAQGDGDAGMDADAVGGGSIVISAPATSPAYTNGKLAVQVSFTPATSMPTNVELLEGDTQIATLTGPSFSFSWDTTTEAEGTYMLTARAEIDGRTVTSPPVSVVVDRTPPTVVPNSRVPAPGASEIALADPIQLVFSEPIAATSAATALVLSQTTGPVATKASLGADGKSLSVSISDRSTVTLSAAAPITLSATVSSTITDLAGNAIADPPQWSWTVPLWLDFGTVQGEAPSLSLDSTGVPFVSTAFEPGAIGSHVYNLQVNRHVQGKSWDASAGSPQTANSLVLASATSISVGADGHPVLAWSEEPMGGTSSIHIARWTGSNWDTSYPSLDAVAGSSTNTYSPWLQTAGGSQLWVAWAEVGTNSVTDVYTANWTGSAWNQLPAIGVIGAGSPILVLGAGGQPVVDWVAGASTAGVSVWGGQTWSTVNYPASYGSGLALDKTQRPVVAFVDGNSVRVRYVDANAEEFATAVPTAMQPSNPRLAIDSLNRAVVAWSDSDGTTKNVKVARWTGSQWDLSFGTLSALSTAGSDATAPTIVLDASDSPIVAWQELDSFRNATYVRKSNR